MRNPSLPDDLSTTDRTSHRSNDVVFPNLGMKVLLVGSCFLSGAISMFAAAGCRRAESLAEADLVCYLGGEDVDPTLYGEKPLRGTYFNRARDDREMEIFVEAMAASKPQFGICRGMQFLHVMNGGKLYQHVTSHAGCDHEIVDLATGQRYMASSMHHQMCIEDDETIPLAYAPGHANLYISPGRELASSKHDDLEAAIWPSILGIGVQGHPEVGGNPAYTAWCLERVKDFVEGRIGHNRINPAVVPQSIIG